MAAVNPIKSEGIYKLLKLEMSTVKGPLDITPYTSTCSIFESVLESTVVAEFIIVDQTSMFSHFNFLEEMITISFTTNEDLPPVLYNFKIVHNPDAVSMPNDKGIVYKLICASEEAVKSKTLVNVPLLRQKTESGVIIKSMLNLLKSKKELFQEKTKGLFNYGLSKITPFEVIDQVRLNAVSATNKGSAFLFFENSKGYHFKTFEGLIEEGLKSIGNKYFIQSTLGNASLLTSKWRNILALKVVNNGNKTVQLLTGGGKNVATRLDMVTGEFETYDNDPTRLEFKRLNVNSNAGSLTTQKEIGADEGRISLSFYSSTDESNELAEKQNILPYYLSTLLNTVVFITIYGDTSISIGDVITCDIPDYEGLTGDRKDNSTLSGNYLVGKCRHILTFGKTAQYMQSLEIIKDGVGGSPARSKL